MNTLPIVQKQPFRLLICPRGVDDSIWAKVLHGYTTSNEPESYIRSHNKRPETKNIQTQCPDCESGKRHKKICRGDKGIKYQKVVNQQKERAQRLNDKLVDDAAKAKQTAKRAKDLAAASVASFNAKANSSASDAATCVLPDEPDEEEPDGGTFQDRPPNITNIAQGARRSADAKQNDQYEKQRVMQYFREQIEPTIHKSKSPNFLIPNVHMCNGSICGPSTEIPDEKLRVIDHIISDRRVVIVMPHKQFRKDFSLNKVVCVAEQCKIAGGLVPQGFLYSVRTAHGLGGERFYVLTCSYLHDKKHGGCGRVFTATNPLVMKQFGPTLKASFPFEVFQRTIVTNDLVQWNTISSLDGVPTAVTARVGSQVSATSTTIRETAQVTSEINRRVGASGGLGDMLQVPSRDEPVELMRSFLSGTHTGRSLSRHFLDSLLVKHTSYLSGLFVAAVDREPCQVLRLDHTFKVSSIVMFILGKTKAHRFTAMVTGMNEYGKLVLACFVRRKDHESMELPIKDLDERAARLNPPMKTGDKRERAGIDTCIVDNPNGDRSFLERILPGLQLTGDAYHYMAEITKAVKSRSKGIAVFAASVASSWWSADKSDVAEEEARDVAAGKQPSSFALFGKNSRVRHYTARGRTILTKIKTAVSVAKQTLKLKFNEEKLCKAIDRLEGAIAAGFVEDPRSGSYVQIGMEMVSRALIYITRRGSSTLECAHRVLRKIVHCSSSSLVKGDLMVKGFVYRWNRRKEARLRGRNPDNEVFDPAVLNENKLVVDKLASLLNEEALKAHNKLNAGHNSNFWVVLIPVSVGFSSSLGAFRKGSEERVEESFRIAVAFAISRARTEQLENGQGDDEDDDDAFFVDENEDEVEFGACSSAAVSMTRPARFLLQRLKDHIIGSKLIHSPITTDDAFTLYKPLPVDTEEETKLFDILVKSAVFSPYNYVDEISKDGAGVYTRMAYKSVKESKRWKLVDMAHWWNVQTWATHGSGRMKQIVPVQWRNTKKGVIVLPEDVCEQIKTIDMNKVWLKDTTLFTKAIAHHAQTRLAELGLSTREGALVDTKERAHYARCESDKQTSQLPSAATGGGVVVSQSQRRLKAMLSGGVTVHAIPVACALCGADFQCGPGHADTCPVVRYFPGGSRSKKEDWLVQEPLVRLEGESVGRAQVRLTQGYLSKSQRTPPMQGCEDETLLSELVGRRRPRPRPRPASIVSAASTFNMPSKRLRTALVGRDSTNIRARLKTYPVSQVFNNTVCGVADLGRLVDLSPAGWLNDQCINGLLCWFTAGADFVAFDTGNRLHVPTGTSHEARVHARGDVMNANRAVFLPWNKNGSHWTLWVVRPQDKSIAHLEPFVEGVDEVDRAMQTDVLAWVTAATKTSVHDWNVDMDPAGLPRQVDGYNCGVILLLFALRMIVGLDVSGVDTSVNALAEARLVLASDFIDGKSAREMAVSLGWELVLID